MINEEKEVMETAGIFSRKSVIVSEGMKIRQKKVVKSCVWMECADGSVRRYFAEELFGINGLRVVVRYDPYHPASVQVLSGGRIFCVAEEVEE